MVPVAAVVTVKTSVPLPAVGFNDDAEVGADMVIPAGSVPVAGVKDNCALAIVVPVKYPEGNENVIVFPPGMALDVVNLPVMDATSTPCTPIDDPSLKANVGGDTFVTDVPSVAPSRTRGIMLFTNIIAIRTPNKILSLLGIFRNSSIVKRSVILF
jgi:hypothetical protein